MTLQEIDAALAQLPASPKTDADLDARATLMTRRIELDQSIRRAAANSRPQPQGDLVVNVPAGAGISHLYGRNGRVVRSRLTEDGRLVLDLSMQEFKHLLMSRQGFEWERSNPDAMRRLGEVA
jgi:hypothetical protein